MGPFERAFRELIMVEGGYSDNPLDSGGKTKYGVTEAVARESGYQGLIEDLTLDQAQHIFYKRYWSKLRLDEVALIDESIAHELFDTGVNCGTGVAATFLQRSLNVLNRQAKDYPDVVVDGDLGAKTLEALKAYVYRRGLNGWSVLLRALNSLQGARYIELAERREKDEAFLFGWLLNRVK